MLSEILSRSSADFLSCCSAVYCIRLQSTSLSDLCQRRPEAAQLYVTALSETGRKEGLGGFEIPKAVWLCAQPFTVDNDILTPTMKLKRAHATKAFAPQIKELYAQIKAAAVGKQSPLAPASPAPSSSS